MLLVADNTAAVGQEALSSQTRYHSRSSGYFQRHKPEFCANQQLLKATGVSLPPASYRYNLSGWEVETAEIMLPAAVVRDITVGGLVTLALIRAEPDWQGSHS